MTPEKRETAIKWLKEEIRSLHIAPKINGCGPENWADLLEVMETCLDAVRGHENKPLTMEQLRKIDGQPVWVEDLKNHDRSAWRLIYWDRGKYLVLIAKSSDGYILEEYGQTWLAYAYPPAHIDREAWTAEWIKYDGYTECSKCGHWYDSPDSEDDGDRPAFCPSCGRAMTPAAWAELEKRLKGSERVKCLIENLEVNYPCSRACPLYGDCVSAFLEAKKQQARTNADRIRAMSDEELAKHIWKKFGCPPLKDHITCGYVGDCRDCWLEWLRQPAEEG